MALDQKQKKMLRKFIAFNLRVPAKTYEQIADKMSSMEDTALVAELDKWAVNYKAQLEAGIAKAQAEIGEL